jgi:hypothetical protein
VESRVSKALAFCLFVETRFIASIAALRRHKWRLYGEKFKRNKLAKKRRISGAFFFTFNPKNARIKADEF